MLSLVRQSASVSYLKYIVFFLVLVSTNMLYVTYTVDREIFAIKKFSPVAWAAKIKCTKIKYTYTRFIAEPSGGEN